MRGKHLCADTVQSLTFFYRFNFRFWKKRQTGRETKEVEENSAVVVEILPFSLITPSMQAATEKCWLCVCACAESGCARFTLGPAMAEGE